MSASVPRAVLWLRRNKGGLWVSPSALSGGLDSSTIACIMRDILNETSSNSIKTITSCSTDKRFDESKYADSVNHKINANSFKVYPTFEKLKTDVERLIWHMDYPFASTSIFSQWCVFEHAKKQDLSVMINGQGADEQLAGYEGNDVTFYTGLMVKKRFLVLSREIYAYKRYKGKWPAIELVGAIQQILPDKLLNRIPEKYKFLKKNVKNWLIPKEAFKSPKWPNSLRESLIKQVTQSPLPTLLRNEDRTSMAFSVESRVPFMDYRLIEFTLSLPEEFVYRLGERKYILRQAFTGYIPDLVVNRKDKMGFVSAGEKWMVEDTESKIWFNDLIKKYAILGSDILIPNKAIKFVEEIQSGTRKFSNDIWQLVNFGIWLNLMEKYKKQTL